jgi:uncharacterized membrane protein YdjX (TVP38/TMEM64 family)
MKRRGRARRLIPLALILGATAVVVAMGWHKQLTLENLIENRSAIVASVAAHRGAALAAFVALYATTVALSIPGATVLTVSGGIVFGTLPGGITAILGATAGATVIFLVARSAFGGWLVARAGPFAERLAKGFRDNAFSYLLFLRLVPLFPFWLVNIVPALCGVSLGSYIAATVVGIIPATFAFTLFGAGIDSVLAAQQAAFDACVAAGRPGCRMAFDPWAAATPQMIAALIAVSAVALVPLVVRHFRLSRQAA